MILSLEQSANNVFSQFVADLQLPGCEVHLYKGPNAFGGVMDSPERTKEMIVLWPSDNLYCLQGVRPGMKKRAADNDVLQRSMVAFDYDCRNELQKKQNTPVTDDDVLKLAHEIIEALKPHQIYGKMRYAVLSGNGLHLWFYGLPVLVVKEEWAAGMKDIFEDANTLTPIPCDMGCGNAGRIMRLPCSNNCKAVPPKLVRFLFWAPEACVPPLAFVQERGRLRLAQQQVRETVDKREFEQIYPDDGSDVINLINQIPIEQVVFQLLGCKPKHKRDGGIRFIDRDGKERGFFKHHQHNIIVYEGTSLFDPPLGVGYNCFGLVRVVLKCSTKEVIEWFCLRSAIVRMTRQRSQNAWADKRRKDDLFLLFPSFR